MQRREQLSAKRSSVLAARQAYDPAAHPNGRISKIFRQFPGNDWMEQVSLLHCCAHCGHPCL